MKTKLVMLVLAACGVVATLPAAAAEQDHVGYTYSQDYQRDFDRGFFFGAEAWYANVRNLHFEPVLSTAGAPIGGRLLDVDFDYEFTGRYFIGYQANRRVGRFTLRYWDYNEGERRSEIGNSFYVATDTHPTRGNVVSNSFEALADVDMEYAEVEWRKDFGQGRKFTGYWTLAATAWELERETDSFHFDVDADGDPIDFLAHVNTFASTKAAGGKVGIGGTYQFNNRISMGAYMAIGFMSTEQDWLYLDENLPGQVVAFLERQDTELTTTQFEGDLNFHLRVTHGFEIDWGWRYFQFDDAIPDDRFVDNEGTFTTVEQPHEIAFEGPYINGRYITGLSKIDTDGDGVLDVYDDCPDTPTGAWVDPKGCPRDLDEDGVYDGIDRCPGTDFGTRVDEWGCGVDSDGDTVPDGLDLCPNTPSCAHVDGKGCPKDSDGDGVSDGCDACPTSASGSRVDASGCATDGDSDGDTVPDSRDKCPGTQRGAKVDADGCELLVSMILHFASDSAEISAADQAMLDRIAHALRADGGQFEVAGHADATNTVEYNQALSERRAAAVREYLVAHGVPASNLTAVGYSELKPVATNDTAEGRAMNRRVEIVRR